MKFRVAMLALTASLAVATPASADSFFVNGFGDSFTPPACTPAGGPGVWNCTTLRAAVAHANETTGDQDGILLMPGTYTLTAGGLAINGSMTIAGSDVRQTVIRAVDSGAPIITVGGGSTAGLSLVTLSGGTSANLSVASGSEVAATITRFTAASGAGILNQGTLSLVHSLVDGNFGPGINNAGNLSQSASLVVLNSTIAGNSGIGLLSSGEETDDVALLHVTIGRNGGAGVQLVTGQQADANASILAANGGPNCAGGTLNGEFNVDSGNSCGLAPGANRVNTDPLLAAALSAQGGQTDVLTIPANSLAIDYVTPCVMSIDQRLFYRFTAFGPPCDAGAYELSGVDPGLGGGGGGGEEQPPPPPVPTPVPPAPTPEPTPVAVVNQTAVVAEKRGTVKIQLRGSKRFVDLDATQGIPMGSTIDTRKGAVEITTVPKAGAPPEKATFYDGLFKLTQRGGITNLTLVEALDCKKAKRASASQKAKKPKKRKLWGDGKGAFRTTGRYSAATVRGTRWLVEDTCTTTTTRVRQGSVTVQHGKKRIIVRAGKKYVARAKK